MKAMWSAFDSGYLEYGVRMYKSFAKFNPDIPMYFGDFGFMLPGQLKRIEDIGVTVLRRKHNWMPRLFNGIDMLAPEFFDDVPWKQLLWIDADTLVLDDVRDVFDYEEDYVGMGPMGCEAAEDQFGRPNFTFGFWCCNSDVLMDGLYGWMKRNHYRIARERTGGTRVIHSSGCSSRQLDLDIYSFGKWKIGRAKYEDGRVCYQNNFETVYPRLAHLNRVYGDKRLKSGVLARWYHDHVDETAEVKCKGSETYVVSLIGGIGNIIQTTPFMQFLRDEGHTVIARNHEYAYCGEICEMVSPAYDRMIGPDEEVDGAIEKGSLMGTAEGKELVLQMPEWQAWFAWHDFYPPEEAVAIIDFEEQKSPSHIVLAPCCKPNWPMKRWPYWNDLIERLPGCAVVGLPEDGGDLKGDFIDLRGKTSLKELAGVLADADFVVAEEGGIAHLAAAAGTQTYILYGGTDPVKNRCPANSLHITTPKELECQPCQYRGWHTEGSGMDTVYHGCHPDRQIDGHAVCMATLNCDYVMMLIDSHENA